MVYLIDASVYVFRAWHAWHFDLADDDGNPTHALYGFARFLSDLIERRAPRHIAVAFDESRAGGLRRRLYPAYKANREPAPLALRRQFTLCREFCRHLGVAEFASEEYEADDLIGTLAAACRGEGLAVTIVSCDKDLAQLIGPDDVFWDYADASEYRYGQIAARFGVAPERMADYLALRGDAVDNIPGVPGIGPKTAAALMQAFASLEELFAALDDGTPAGEYAATRVGATRIGMPAFAALPVRRPAQLAARLAEHRERLWLARALTRIRCDAPLPIAGSGALLRQPPDAERVATFCATHGFGALLARQAGRLAERLAEHRAAAVIP